MIYTKVACAAALGVLLPLIPLAAAIRKPEAVLVHPKTKPFMKSKRLGEKPNEDPAAPPEDDEEHGGDNALFSPAAASPSLRAVQDAYPEPAAGKDKKKQENTPKEDDVDTSAIYTLRGKRRPERVLNSDSDAEVHTDLIIAEGGTKLIIAEGGTKLIPSPKEVPNSSSPTEGPTSSPTEGPTSPPTAGKSPITVSDWYPNWSGGSNECLNDGKSPLYMKIFGTYFESSLASCCDRFFSWDYDWCAGDSTTLPTGFYPNWEGTENICLESSEKMPFYIRSNPSQYMFSDIESCCDRHYYYAFDKCIIGSGGSSTHSSNWYANYSDMICQKDCPKTEGGSCGGTPPPWNQLYASASQCCDAKLYWMDSEECKNDSVVG